MLSDLKKVKSQKRIELLCATRNQRLLSTKGLSTLMILNAPVMQKKMTAEIRSNEETEIGRHKLVTDKPRFPSSSLSVTNSIFANDNPVSDLSVPKEFNPDAVQSIPNTINIYDIYHDTGTNHQILESTSTDRSRESRLHPRTFVDKVSKLFVFKK